MPRAIYGDFSRRASLRKPEPSFSSCIDAAVVIAMSGGDRCGGKRPPIECRHNGENKNDNATVPDAVGGIAVRRGDDRTCLAPLGISATRRRESEARVDAARR